MTQSLSLIETNLRNDALHHAIASGCAASDTIPTAKRFHDFLTGKETEAENEADTPGESA